LQKKLHHQRLNGAISDTLLLLEHPPTVTIGRSGSLENVLVSSEQLTQEEISLFFISRGGDVTYHGPGQLVGYPIMDLSHRGKDIHAMFMTLRRFSYGPLRTSQSALLETRAMQGFGYRMKRSPPLDSVYEDGSQCTGLLSMWTQTSRISHSSIPVAFQIEKQPPCLSSSAERCTWKQ
jgi:hypothetical protein